MVLKRGRYVTFRSLVRSNLLNVNNNSARLLIIFLVLVLVLISGCNIYTKPIESIREEKPSEIIDLSDYPHPFSIDNVFVGIVVLPDKPSDLVVESYTVIMEKIQIRNVGPVRIVNGTHPNIERESPSTAFASDIKDVKMRNAIVIGNSCINKASAELIDSTENCLKDFEKNKSFIMLFRNNNKVQILVAGYDDLETLKAAKVLGNYDQYNLSGTIVEVTGSPENLTRKVLK